MLLLVALIVLCSNLSDAVPVIYNRTGGEVVIPPGSADPSITSITWKHNEDIAVEWYGGEPSFYRHFNGSTALNTRTGVLTISGLTRDHIGSYTAEINNKVADTTEVRIISPVPKPTVSKQCDAEMTYCTLTCEGNTTDAEPVECSWHIFDVHTYRRGQQFNLTKYDHDPWYECEMKNPISSETSERFPNPFSSRIWVIIVVLAVLALLLIVLIGGIVIYKRKSKKKNVNLVAVVSNGNTPAVSIQETSVLIPQTSSVVPDISNETAVMNACETSNPDKTSENPNDEPATTTSEGQETLTPVTEKNNEAAMDSQDQETSRNDLNTAASPETEKSSEESNVEETTRPLLEEQI